MLSLAPEFFSASPFIPHGHCYLWKPGLVTLHLASDALIALAYYSIPITLWYFVQKRTDLPYNWIFQLFASFIIACGTTHLMEVWTLWHPIYWVSGGIKAVTALVSVTTAILLVPLVPRALALPSPAQLEQANQELQAQVAERLRVEAELREYRDRLEELVQERTAEILRTNQQLQQEIDRRQQVEAEREQLLVREKNAREQAEAANRIKDEFLSILSHELRTPLNAILGWTQMLRSPRRKIDDATTARALETIERNARGQATLIEDLLDISRIITGKLRLSVRPVELMAAVEGAIDTVRPAADAKQIQIQTMLDPEASLVMGDLDRLQQVVWNLLSNAVKFTPRGGRVQVVLRRVDSSVAVVVSDNGRGIRPEFLPHVFERFRQADGSTTRSFSGLGLGLSIVRHLVELHGGSIRAESEGEGHGAAFTMTLPIAPVKNLPVVEAPHPTANNHLPFDDLPLLDSISVLVVDDEADAREILATALEQCGATVITAGCAEEALQQLEHQRPSILVSDIGMPGTDGYSLIRLVRSHPQLKPIPAIALTAYARVEDRTRALAAGFQLHVAKPVNLLELATAIASLTQRNGLSTSLTSSEISAPQSGNN